MTRLAVFLTNNEISAAVDADGLVTAGDRGEAFVMARFETYTVGSQFIVLPKGLKFEYPGEPEVNYIDTLVAAKLKKLRIAPSGLCDDEVFLRRVYLDVVGLPPTVEEYDTVHGLDRARQAGEVDRRAARTQGILRDLGEQVGRVAPDPVGRQQEVNYKAMFLYYNWLVEKLSKNTPMDEMVQELLGANGGTFKNPATNFYQTTNDTLALTENVAQVFMGMRIQCAQCHNHPFDRWTQDDYYGFAAFFSPDRPQAGRGLPRDDRLQLGRRRGEPPGRRPGDEAEVPRRRRRPTSPARTAAWSWPSGSPRRENPWFATSFANRVWAHFIGAGIVEPVDDFRVSNPATQPRAARRAGQAVHRLEVRPQAPGARHLQLADLPAIDPAQRNQRQPTSGTSPTPCSGGSRPRTCSTRSAR